MPRLVDSCGDALYGFCLRLARSKDGADELYQQTFLRAMELCGRIDEGKNPRAYLFGIAVRLWRNESRKLGRRAALSAKEELFPSEPEAPSAQDEALRRQLLGSVRVLCDRLPEKFRAIVLMRYGGSLSMAEIAAALGLKQGTVKSRLFKARLIIKKGLEAEGYESLE